MDTTWEYLEESFFIAIIAIYNVIELLRFHACIFVLLMSEDKLSCASPEMIAKPRLSDLALCSMAGKGPNGELAYSRCASWEHGSMGALGQEGGVGCADRL